MKNIRIGLARFYNGNSIKLVNGESMALKLKLKEYEIDIHISDKTRHVLPVVSAEPPEPKIPVKNERPSARQSMVSPGPDKYPADLYIELIATTLIGIEDDLFRRFNEKEQEARNAVLKLSQAHKQELEKVLNYAAGFLGLRINSDLVRLPILDSDIILAYREGTSYAFDFNMMTIETKEKICIDASDKGGREVLDSIRKVRPESLPEDVSEALGWMLRGWASNDKVLRFVSFFTALESIIPKEDNPAFTTHKNEKAELMEMLDTCGLGTAKDRIKNFIENVNSPRPLNSSFEHWAQSAGLAGWEADVAAFKKFNVKRNRLLHAGDLRAVSFPEVVSPEVITLETIASKYLSWRIFGNWKRYSV